MILRRLGNKAKLASKITPHFPKHEIYIEPFFGAGGMYFNKPKAKYNFLNDLDSNVTNCFDVLINHKDELKTYIEMLPQHSEVFEIAKKRVPKDNIEKAVFFLFLSNFGFMGQPDTLQFGVQNNKKTLLNNLEKTYLDLAKNENQFMNYDFRDVLSKIAYRTENDKNKTFIYCDPPYLGTADNYSNSFKEQDSIDLFDVLQNSGMKWAMSEFDNPFILEQAKQRNLNIIIIGERENLKRNRRTEILITNYNQQNNLFN